MKKQLIIASALAITSISFAQKKELKAADKAIKKDNYAEAKTALSQVESMMGSMDDDQKSDYYYLKAATLYAGGNGSQSDIDAAVKALSKTTSSDATELKQKMLTNFLDKGNKQYESKKYDLASKNFEYVYRVSPKDTAFLYNAAIASDVAQNFDQALKYYEELLSTGYTGIESKYYAVNKETGQEEEMGSKESMDLYVKSGDYIKPTQKLSDSKEADIIKRIAAIYTSQGDTEKAISAIQKAREKDPSDVDLIIAEANLYYELKDLEKYKQLIGEAVKLNPNNPDLFYNLGVISGEAGNTDDAIKYYKRAIELKPDYLNAHMNMAVATLAKEKDIVEEMNGLGNSAKDNKRYDELKAERMSIYGKAVPSLEAVLKYDDDNIEAMRTLMNIYNALGESAKAKDLKAKLDSM